ncbi:MAG: sialidase family protein [Breznakibacter sp.]
MMMLKSIILTSLVFSYYLDTLAQTETSYARSGMKTKLEIAWDADNYGTIQWQTSTNNGISWSDIANAVSPSYEFTAYSDGLYRAEINAQPQCEPVYVTRAVKTVNFNVTLISVAVNSADFEVSGFDFQDANIVEYGFCYNLSDLNTRGYTEMNKVKVGTEVPSGSTFELTCPNLAPGTSYSIRAYFKTQDGSMVYGPGRIAKTLPGIKWTPENWQITKTSVAARFELADYSSILGNPNVAFRFGTTIDNLQSVNVTDLGNYKYATDLIPNLAPNTKYIAQARATVDGEVLTITKNVTTLSDYSGIEVDQTTSPVQHTIRWDATKTLHRISPEGLQAEYPRIIRLNADTLLCVYHGGSGSDHWVNIYLQKSVDNGRTWMSPAILMDKEKSTIGGRYWRFCNPEIIRLHNGWILMSFVGNGNPETNDNCHVMVMLSKDNGETWGDPQIIGRGRTWEPMVVQLPNGELEMLVASEAAWYPGSNLYQEIMYSRSTDNGETWTELKRAAYSPNRRDGMPVAVVLQGNKGVLFGIEIVNDGGFGSPSLLKRSLDGEWDATPWDGTSDDLRWRVNMDAHGGAPYVLQLPTGEIVMSAHVNGRNGIWQTSYPRIVVGDNNGQNLTTAVTPLTNLPDNVGAYYNSLFLKDNETMWLVITNSEYSGTTRVKGEIKYLEGKIVEKK